MKMASMMDRIFNIVGYIDSSIKPEILVVYGALAVLITFCINWALATLLVMLKPFTCAAILLAFIRPDIAQNFLQEDSLKQVAEKSKSLFCGAAGLLLKLGAHFREVFQ